MIGARQLSNGDLIFVKVQDIPPSLVGYEQDLYDPQLFHLKYLDCKQRENRIKITPCRKRIPIEWCNKLDCKIDALVCLGCQVREP